MPSKNTIRHLQENGYYHVYNRGVEKRKIFLCDEDFQVFLHFLKTYLSPREIKEDSNSKEKYQETQRKNFTGEIDLLAFCLMPNHYHLLLRQNNDQSMPEFMRCLITAYVMYFNKRYQRTGTLFQGRYKAAIVGNDDYLLHLSRYIHQNPINDVKGQTLDILGQYDYSSYPDYVGIKDREWIDRKIILESFSSAERIDSKKFDTYKVFVKDIENNEELSLGSLTLDGH